MELDAQTQTTAVIALKFWGCSRCTAPDRPCWAQCEQGPPLGREITFEVFQPM